MTQLEFFLIDPLDSLTQIETAKISHWGLKMMFLCTKKKTLKHISQKSKKKFFFILKDEDKMT